MYTSPLTNSKNTNLLYKQKSIPLFQNMYYATKEEALNAKTIDVDLVQCLDTGFVFSGGFDINKLEYDKNYQNEQANSPFFQEHLSIVIDLLNKEGLLNGKILEIGCGKGFFMDLIAENGFEIIGIDPTYEGDSDKIIKEYYSEKFAYLNADLIVLRHTLEHIPKPLDFLQMIAKSNNYKGHIYIEIPTFDWIVKHNSIEDIFYEHCNYFTTESISQLFEECNVVPLFNEQYIGIVANLSQVKKEIKPVQNIEVHNFNFLDKLNEYKNSLDKINNIAIWGAGAKGSTFLNLLDKNSNKIKCVFDIHPKKQNMYIGGTGHQILKPPPFEIDNIIVMNDNYIQEIRESLPKKINLITL